MLLFLAYDENIWESFIFLELYPVRKAVEVDQDECHKCGLAYKAHPITPVEEYRLSTTYEKYCLKDFFKYRFIEISKVM